MTSLPLPVRELYLFWVARGRRQSCLYFPWQLEDMQFLPIPLLNSIQIHWISALTPAPSPRITFTNLCPLCYFPVYSFFEMGWNTCLFGPALCYHIAVVFFLCLKQRSRSSPTISFLFATLQSYAEELLSLPSNLSFFLVIIQSWCAWFESNVTERRHFAEWIQTRESTQTKEEVKRLKVWRKDKADTIKSSFLFRADWICGARHSGYP